MRKIYLFLCCVLLSAPALAETADVITARSPDHRVALLELYTSQGCSSCPPAEDWLSRLKVSGISPEQVIPLAFHVTYWDYIGWQDRFAAARYDERQRRIAAYNAQRTIYTPQFVLAGEDYRRYASFSRDIRELVSMPATLRLALSVNRVRTDDLDVVLSASAVDKDLERALLYLAVYENDLQSQVNDGENAGRLLHHDYVVKQLYGPFRRELVSGQAAVTQTVKIEQDWKAGNLNLVAFAQRPHSGEVLQAVHLGLEAIEGVTR